MKTEAIIEALLFSSPEALSIEELIKTTQKPKKEIQNSLQKLQKFYQEQERAFQLMQTASGYQLKTKQEFALWINKSTHVKKYHLSKSALETLAVITYKQPISKQGINQMRKVDSSGTIKNLLQKNLIRISGRSDSIGKPLLYATSTKFLNVLGLKKLSDMPQINE